PSPPRNEPAGTFRRGRCPIRKDVAKGAPMKRSAMQGGRALEVVVSLEDSVIEVAHLRTPGKVTLPGEEQVILAAVDPAGRAWVVERPEPDAPMRPLPQGEDVRLEAGLLRVWVREVDAAPPAPRGGIGFERRILALVAASAVVHGIL